MDNTKSDTDIYDAINKVFDIDFLKVAGLDVIKEDNYVQKIIY